MEWKEEEFEAEAIMVEGVAYLVLDSEEVLVAEDGTEIDLEEVDEELE